MIITLGRAVPAGCDGGCGSHAGPQGVITFRERRKAPLGISAQSDDLGGRNQPFGLSERRLLEVLSDIDERNPQLPQFRLHAAGAVYAEQHHHVGSQCHQTFIIDIPVEPHIADTVAVRGDIFVGDVVDARDPHDPVNGANGIEHRHITR